jgi:hypothetical protein
MIPNPPPLMQTGRFWTAEKIYWTVAHGVHMAGMSAFAHRPPQADIWAIAAFVKDLPKLTVEQYNNLRDQAKANPYVAPPEPSASAPDGKRGRIALEQYNRNDCHSIPSLGASDESYFGTSLAGMGVRLHRWRARQYARQSRRLHHASEEAAAEGRDA